MIYKQAFYHHQTNQYNVSKPKNPSPTVKGSNVPSVEGHIAPTPATEGSLDAAQAQNNSAVSADLSGATAQAQGTKCSSNSR